MERQEKCNKRKHTVELQDCIESHLITSCAAIVREWVIDTATDTKPANASPALFCGLLHFIKLGHSGRRLWWAFFTHAAGEFYTQLILFSIFQMRQLERDRHGPSQITTMYLFLMHNSDFWSDLKFWHI